MKHVVRAISGRMQHESLPLPVTTAPAAIKLKELTAEEQWRPLAEAGFDHERFATYVWRSVRAKRRHEDREVTPDAGTAHPGR